MEIYTLSKIRPYISFSFCKLLRLKSFFFLCKFPRVVKNLNYLYDTSSKICGKRETNKIIKYMYCDFLTGGSTFEELEKTVENMDRQGLYSSIGYCREFLTNKEEHDVEMIISSYLKTVEISVKYNSSNSIALKVSSLCDIDKLKEFNRIQVNLSKISKLIELNNTTEHMNDSSNNLNVNLTKEGLDFFKSKKTELGLNLMEMFIKFSKEDIENMNHHLNIDKLNELFEYGRDFEKRVNRILSYAEMNKCSVLYDAEQSYIQNIIDSSAFYYASLFNKDFPTVLETVQCYMKDAPSKIENFISFYRENNLKLGFKIVRGAYLNEETKLSEKLGYQRLNWETIEETHNAYNNVVRRLVTEYKCGDKVIFASHNEDTVKLVTELIKDKGEYSEIYCAQLIGISDHITMLSKFNGLKTFKNISFGDIDIMIPYLIRRAEETSILSKLQTQTRLLNDELIIRIKNRILMKKD